MRRVGAMAAVCVVGLLAALQAQEPAWKPFVPEAAAKALIERSLEAADNVKSAERVQAEALLLAGTILASEGKHSDALRAEALAVAKEAGFGKAKTKDLAARLRDPKAVPATGAVKWRAHAEELSTLMNLFRPVAKGGEGLAAELQYNGKLKNLNNTEALIGALASKKLTDANAAKTSKELELMAYRWAVLAAITHDYAPEKGTKGTPKQWHELAHAMRDASIALAHGAAEKDAPGVQAAATRLEATCTKCHSLFR